MSSILGRAGDRKGSPWLLALLAVAPVIAASAIGSAVTTPNLAPWYAGLVKPFFNPPNWVFGPVWTTLYAMMAYAAWRVWSASPRAEWRTEGLILFYVQLALNCFWSIAFFAMRSPEAGVMTIAALWVAIVLTILAFARVDRLAAWLLAPYLAWTSFAAILNVAIWRLN